MWLREQRHKLLKPHDMYMLTWLPPISTRVSCNTNKLSKTSQSNPCVTGLLPIGPIETHTHKHRCLSQLSRPQSWRVVATEVCLLKVLEAGTYSMKVWAHSVSTEVSSWSADRCHPTGLPWWHRRKEPACSAGDPGSIPEWGRSQGEGNGSPLQYSCLGNPMDRGAWRAIVHGVAKSWTQLSN